MHFEGIHSTFTCLWRKRSIHKFKEVTEKVCVWVFAELVEDEPVSEVAVAEDALGGGDVRLGEAADLDDDQESPDRGHQDGHQPEHQVGRRHYGQPKQPEPEQ